MHTNRLIAAAAASLLLVSACGGDDDTGAADTTAATTSTASTAVPASTSTTDGTTTTSVPASTSPIVDGEPVVVPELVPVGMGSTEADGVFPRTVTHFQGDTLIPTEPRRIAVIATGQLDSVLTLGLVPVASTAAVKAEVVPAYLAAEFPQFATELSSMAELGTRAEPNLEAVAAAKPDLILMNNSSAELYPQLSAIAPTIVTEGQGFPWKQDFLLIAAALGRTGDAEQILAEIKAAAQSVGARFAGNPPTVSMVRFTADRTRLFGYRSFTGAIALDAGLLRPESQQFVDPSPSTDISLEQIGMIDGDWLLYSALGTPDESPLASFEGSPLWSGLHAVESGHAVQVDDDTWYLNTGPTTARVVIRQLDEILASE